MALQARFPEQHSSVLAFQHLIIPQDARGDGEWGKMAEHLCSP